MTSLQLSWREWYERKLPSLSKAKDKAQKKWPVVNDHCFARIILDQVVDNERPWHELVQRPAWKNLSEKQLQDAIDLAEKIASGDVDLVELDESSLLKRGKKSKATKSSRSAVSESKTKSKSRSESKSESRSESKSESDSRSDSKPESKLEADSEVKTDSPANIASDSESKNLKLRKRKRKADQDTDTHETDKKHHP